MMSKDEILTMLKQGQSVQQFDLTGIDLSDTDFTTKEMTQFLDCMELSSAVLRHVNLSGGDLSTANLVRADLSDSNLHDVNFTEANLNEALLTRANLKNANLFCTNLAEADLTGANLEGCYLVNANLRDAKVKQIQMSQSTVLPDGTAWSHDRDITQFVNTSHPNFWPSPYWSNSAWG